MLFRCYNYFQRALNGFFVMRKDASDQAAIKVLQSCLEKIPFLQVESIQQADSPGNLRLALRPTRLLHPRLPATHPMSIFVAMGGGLSVSLIIH